jgi:hypothetical protein
MSTRFVAPLAAGGLLALGCAGSADAGPPAPAVEPRPALLVTPDGQCHQFVARVDPNDAQPIPAGPLPAFWGLTCATPGAPADGRKVVDCLLPTRCSEAILTAVSKRHGVTFPLALKPWNDVEDIDGMSTNPPIPRLVVEPDGTCHRFLEDARGARPFMGGEPAGRGAFIGTRCAGPGEEAVAGFPGPGDKVDCGEIRQCPPEAAQVLADWKARR